MLYNTGMITYIILGIIAVIIIWFVVSYNGFVAFINRAKEAWADIDVQLKRRYDLIPNLVNTIKGSTSFEQDTLTKVVEARAKATSISVDPTKIDAATMANISANQTELSSALGRLLVVSEQYPDLKSSQNFLSLQSELADTENKIQASRRFYNGNVRDLNTKIEQFPGNIIAGIFHFVKMEFFQLEAGSVEKEVVEVKF